MGKQVKYAPEVRERVVRLAFEQQEYISQWAALASVAEEIGRTAETLRMWVRAAERQQIPEQQARDCERDRLEELERENRELRQANEILKAACYAPGELERPARGGSCPRCVQACVRDRVDWQATAYRPA